MNVFQNASKLIALILILCFLGIMYLAIFSKKTTVKHSPLIGTHAPQFTLETFDGEKIKLSDFKGKTVILNFWSSWCIPCKDEAIAIERANLKYKNSPVKFVGINIWDDYENAVNFMNRYSVSYLNGYDPSKEIQVNYGVEGVPETFFVDQKGIIIEKFYGQLTNSIISHFVNQMISK